MKRIFAMGMIMLTLTGCSELQVIGTAARDGFQADVVNVEMASYRQQTVRPAYVEEAPVVVAQAVVAKPQRMAVPRQKGLWEGR